jgi:hypothetical protein
MTVSVAEGARRYFEQAIGENKRAQDSAPLNRREMEVGLHAWAGHRNTKAIEKCDDGERAHERQDAGSIAQERFTRIGFGELAGGRVRD